MQLISVPIGSSGAVASLSLVGGQVQVLVSVPVKAEVDALFAAVEKAVPANLGLAPVLAALQAGLDAQLSQP